MVITSIAGTSSDSYRNVIPVCRLAGSLINKEKEDKASLRVIRFENYHPPKTESALLLQAVKR